MPHKGKERKGKRERENNRERAPMHARAFAREGIKRHRGTVKRIDLEVCLF